MYSSGMLSVWNICNTHIFLRKLFDNLLYKLFMFCHRLIYSVTPVIKVFVNIDIFIVITSELLMNSFIDLYNSN